MALSLLTSPSFAQNPPTRISDEGGSKEVFFNLDCVGGGVTCTTSGINATLTVLSAIGNSSNTEVLFNNAGTVDGIPEFTYSSALLSLNGGDLKVYDDDEIQFGDGRDCFMYWDAAGVVDTDTLQLNCGNEIYFQNTWRMNALGYIGMDGTAPVSNQIINVDSSGSLRGSLFFKYNYTGGGIGANITSDVTVSTNQSLSQAFSGKIKLNNSLGVSTGTFLYGFNSEYGVDNTLTTSTNKTYAIHGYRAQHNQGLGAGSGAGDTFNLFGLRVNAMTTIAGSGTTNKFGILTEEDLVLADGADLYFNGTDNGLLSTTKGDTFLEYDNTDTDLELTIDGTQIVDFDDDQIQVAIPISGGRQVFYGTCNADTDVAAGFTDIPIAEAFEDSYYTHTDPNASIQFNQDGLYRVAFDFSWEQTGGNNRSTVQCKLLEDVGAGFVDIAGTDCYGYSRQTSDGEGSCSVEILREFNSTDDIKAQCDVINGVGSPINILANGTRVNIEFLRNS